MNKKLKILSAIFLILGLVSTIGFVSAYRGDSTQVGPNYNEVRHTDIQTAIQNNDYSAWKSLMSENNNSPRILEVINENNFSEFRDAYLANQSGDTEAMNDFRTTLGLGLGQQHRGGNQSGNRINSGFSGKRSGNNSTNQRNMNRANCIYN